MKNGSSSSPNWDPTRMRIPGSCNMSNVSSVRLVKPNLPRNMHVLRHCNEGPRFSSSFLAAMRTKAERIVLCRRPQKEISRDLKLTKKAGEMQVVGSGCLCVILPRGCPAENLRESNRRYVEA
jgi:hypothetical protein